MLIKSSGILNLGSGIFKQRQRSCIVRRFAVLEFILADEILVD
jgi:hypothetical protein